MIEPHTARFQRCDDCIGSAEPTCLSTVVASAPGIMAQSLRSVLESLPLVQVIGMAAGCLSALQMIRDSNADLVVIDANLPIEDVQMLLQQIKNEELPTRSLVLATTRGHAQRALAGGADRVFRRDGSTGQLCALVAALAA
jgi:DNA-binding NarL/FixJ family response regulator